MLLRRIAKNGFPKVPCPQVTFPLGRRIDPVWNHMKDMLTITLVFGPPWADWISTTRRLYCFEDFHNWVSWPKLQNRKVDQLEQSPFIQGSPQQTFPIQNHWELTTPKHYFLEITFVSFYVRTSGSPGGWRCHPTVSFCRFSRLAASSLISKSMQITPFPMVWRRGVIAAIRKVGHWF